MARINDTFAELGVTGAGQKEARLMVLTALVGAPITQGRDLYSADAVLVLDNLTRAVVDEVLAGTRWAGVPSGGGVGGDPDPADIGPTRRSPRPEPSRDDIGAQRAAEQAQAEAYDPTAGGSGEA